MTYDEYFDLVQKKLKPYLEPYKLSDEELVGFMRSEEEVIRNRYSHDMKAFERGEITRGHLEGGCTGGLAHCLSLMFD